MVKKHKNVKIVILSLVIMLLLPTTLSPYAKENVTETSTNSQWTAMYYLCGDNKMSASQQQHLNLIKSVGSTSEVSIAILVDYDGADDTYLYYLNENDLEEQQWEIESDMSNPDTLKEFINKAISDLSSEQYFLQLSSNQGSAWQGVCLDERGDGTMITMPELSDMLSDVTQQGSSKIDLVAVETCLGGNLAFAYELSKYVETYVGYADCGLIGAWPFQQSIAALVDNPSMDSADFSSVIVDNFTPQNVPQYLMMTAIGAYDLSKIDEVISDLDALGNYFLDNKDTIQQEILTAIDQARIYGEFWDIDYFIDIVQFLNSLDIQDPEGANLKNQLIESIENFVLSKNHLPEDNSIGFNFYFPRRTSDYNHALRYNSGILPSSYEQTSFALDTSWDEFLRNLLGIADNTPPEIPSITGPVDGKTGETYTFQIISTDNEDNQLYYYIDWGDETNSGWIGPYDSGETCETSYSWNDKGTYSIMVKAKDERGAESDWSDPLQMNMPKRTKMFDSYVNFLFGLIEDIEYNSQDHFRFLPVKMISLSFGDEQSASIEMLDRTDGGYPCCGHIRPNEYRGIITSNFIFGLWIIK